MSESIGLPIQNVIGQEFLTWLWYNSEAKNGTYYTTKGQNHYSVYVSQRVVVKGGEGDAIETASVSASVNSTLREAKMGLITGKMVVRALLIIEKENLLYSTTLKAEDFTLNSFKTPAISKDDKEDADPDASFLEKMYLLNEGLNLLDDTYLQFLNIRINPQTWAEECKLISEWINTEA